MLDKYFDRQHTSKQVKLLKKKKMKETINRALVFTFYYNINELFTCSSQGTLLLHPTPSHQVSCIKLSHVRSVYKRVGSKNLILPLKQDGEVNLKKCNNHLQ